MREKQPRTSRPPDWALLLIAHVCAENHRRSPRVTWFNTRNRLSSGHTKWDGRTIHISAGTDVYDQQLVVLHEVAHYLTRTRGRKGKRIEAHTIRFWRTAFTLYRRWGDDDFLAYAIQREWNYKMKARQAAREIVSLSENML